MASKKHVFPRRQRHGVVAVLAAVLLTAMLTIVAFAVDIGYICLVKVQAQTAADAAALAAGQELLGTAALQDNFFAALLNARLVAAEYAGYQQVGGNPASVNPLTDVTIGTLVDPSQPTEQLDTSNPYSYNALQVRVAIDDSQPGSASLFFARALGITAIHTEATATVWFGNQVVGFQPTTARPNTSLLPLAVEAGAWDSLINGCGSDQWKLDPATGNVVAGQDGINELTLEPLTSSNGNLGTVIVGSDPDTHHLLSHQIRDGIRSKDLSDIGGSLQLDSITRVVALNGQQALDDALEDDFRNEVGTARSVLLYQSASGSGSNVTFTISGFAGIRLLEVDLHAGDHRIVVQPAFVIDRTAVTAGWGTGSYFVHQPLHLVR